MPTDPRSTPDRVTALLTPALEAAGFELEDVTITRAGRRSVVQVVVDRESGLDLDAVAEASRAVDAVLEADAEVIPGEYVLEVTSPGVDRPLTLPRHWQRNVGRLVAVTLREGAPVTGRITAAGDSSADLTTAPVKGRPGKPVVLAYADVLEALIQVEFSRPGVPEDPEDLDDVDDVDDDELDDDADDADDEDGA